MNTMNELSINNSYHTFSYEHDKRTFHKQFYPSINTIISNQNRTNSFYWTITNHVFTLAESLGFEDSELPSVSDEELLSSSSFDPSSQTSLSTNSFLL